MDQVAIVPGANVPLANLILFAALKLPMPTFTVSSIYNVICAWYPSYQAEPERWLLRIMLEVLAMRTMRQVTVYGQRTDMWCLNFPRELFPHYQTLLLQGDSPAEPEGPIVASAGPLTPAEVESTRKNLFTMGYNLSETSQGAQPSQVPRSNPSGPTATTANASNQAAARPTPSTSANAAGTSATASVYIPVSEESFNSVSAAFRSGGQVRVVPIGSELRLVCTLPLQADQVAPALAASTGPTITVPRRR